MNKRKTFFKLAKTKQIIEWIRLGIFGLMFTAMSAFMYIVSGYEPVVLYALVGMLAIFLIIVLGTYLIGQAIHRNSSKPDDNSLTSDLDTTYYQPLAKATVSPGEHIVEWYGPMGRNDIRGLGYQIFAKEKISGENTIIATETQFICLMIGPNDVEAISSILGDIVQTTPDGSGIGIRKENFTVAYYKHWESIMDMLKQKPLDSVLNTHRNYGIPYDLIQSVRYKKRFFNPGIDIVLHDGRKFVYSGFSKQRLESMERFLNTKIVNTRP